MSIYSLVCKKSVWALNEMYVTLIASGTVDDRVMEVMKKKMKLVEAIIGKRIKGESDEDTEAIEGLGEDVEFAASSEITELFDALRNDAQAGGHP